MLVHKRGTFCVRVDSFVLTLEKREFRGAESAYLYACARLLLHVRSVVVDMGFWILGSYGVGLCGKGTEAVCFSGLVLSCRLYWFLCVLL
jgi:hypothetical protein